ncbi:urea transporter [Ferviditalea candida]|uniref:Urea transporter n=1 Tax=Ferviditalea candida TaxID=3108399 RepID=A0ABU5ZMT1_9BACL|nr:urea transporter [Paenibacillaceae bacterium T2]
MSPAESAQQAGISFIKAVLRGISQVILIENALTGLAALIGIFSASYGLGIVAALSSIIGTAVGRCCGAERKVVDQGLFGYNAVLTGIAIALFLDGPGKWIVAPAAAFLSAIFAASMMNWLGRIQLPVFTFPFIVLTWVILLAAYRMDFIALNPVLNPQNVSDIHQSLTDIPDILQGVVHGVGQVFIMDDFIAGLIILSGVFLAGIRPGISAVLGSAAAWLTAYLLGAESSWIDQGLYGYNAVLTMLALSWTFPSERGRRFSYLAGLAAAASSVPVTSGISVFLAPYGLPAFTMPFTLTAWISLSARQWFQKAGSS